MEKIYTSINKEYIMTCYRKKTDGFKKSNAFLFL
jgi:hypothetical protein